jgi:hypothetical protein
VCQVFLQLFLPSKIVTTQAIKSREATILLVKKAKNGIFLVNLIEFDLVNTL